MKISQLKICAVFWLKLIIIYGEVANIFNLSHGFYCP